MLGVEIMTKYQMIMLTNLISYIEFSPNKDLNFILQQLIKIKNDDRAYWQV